MPANLVSLMAGGSGAVPPSSSSGRRSETPKTKAVAPSPLDTETPAQKQAAAKMALRKQLEKTLLQVNCMIVLREIIY